MQYIEVWIQEDDASCYFSWIKIGSGLSLPLVTNCRASQKNLPFRLFSLKCHLVEFHRKETLFETVSHVGKTMFCLEISQTAASKYLMNGYVCVSTTFLFFFFKETRRQEMQTYILKSSAKRRALYFFFFIEKFSAKSLPKPNCK